jgi:thiamine-phosphate pyrophosphorylase
LVSSAPDLPSRLLVISDRHQARGTITEIAAAISGRGRCEWLLFRDKDMPSEERRRVAFELREITRRVGTALSISADIALARECRADGVHLQAMDRIIEARQALGPDALIGASLHVPHEARAALEAGADYGTLSPIFATASKPGYGPTLGTVGITEAAGFGLPVLVLGGVEPGNAAACLRAGAAGVAVMGGVMRAEDPAAVVSAYRSAL